MLERLTSLLKLPNHLSLDASIIAVVWQWLVTSSVTSPPGGPLARPDLVGTAATFVLFVTVWLVYCGDRLLDVRRLDFQREVAERHRFVRRWSRVLWPIWWIMLVTDVAVAFTSIDRSLLFAGITLLAAIALYGLFVHGPTVIARPLPKELLVGVLFAIGICLPLCCRSFQWITLATITLLAGLFVLNCLCVATMQQIADRQQGVASAIGMYPMLERSQSIAAIGLAIAAISLVQFDVISLVLGISVTLSAAGLAITSWRIAGVNVDEAKWVWEYVADYVLIAPVFFISIFR